jgi:hypothetical protein
MRFGSPKRPPLKFLAALATVGALGACSESSTGPLPARTPGVDAAVIAPWTSWDENFAVKFSGLPWTWPSKTYAADTTIQKFSINPATGAFVNFGSNNKLVIPPMTLCDVGTSYGPTEWEKPCQPETSWTTITVKTWLGSNGRPYARFYPDVRFVPGNGATLFFYDASLVDYSKVIIPYCTAGEMCVD